MKNCVRILFAFITGIICNLLTAFMGYMFDVEHPFLWSCAADAIIVVAVFIGFGILAREIKEDTDRKMNRINDIHNRKVAEQRRGNAVHGTN